MSGHDETFLPPEEEGAKHPPTPAPPNFGQSSAGKPAVVFQSTDTQPGFPVFSGPSMASDAEETMTPPPPKRPGAPTPGAQSTPPPVGNPAPGDGERSSTDFPPPPIGPLANGTPPSGPATDSARPTGPRHAAPQPQWTSAPYSGPEAEVPEAERTVANGSGPYDQPPYGGVPEAERTVANGSNHYDPAPGFPPSGRSPYDSASGPYGGPADKIPEAERTATDDPGPETPYGAPGLDPTGQGSRDGASPFGTSFGAATGGEAPGSGAPPYGGASPHDAPSAAGGPANGFPDPDAERTANNASSPTSVPTPGVPTPESGGKTVTFEDANGQRTLAIARFGAGTSSSAPGPALTPDAILPPGTPPQAPPEPPPPDLGATSTGPIPRLGAGPGFPGGPSTPPPHGGGRGGSSGARRALLVGGGLLAALVLGGGGALAVTELSGGSSKERHIAQSQPPPAPTQAMPTPTPSKTKPKHKPKHVPVDIRDEKKDPKPLTITEVFPSSHITLAGTTFVRVKTVINDHCSLAANGPFATELTREHCRRVVRATFVSEDKKLAVTTGIAVMPTDAAAKASLKLQDPAHYEWFRGMKATGAPKIDHAGGFAASTLRGRYIIYAYATYADGHKPAAKDDTLKKVGAAFRDSTARPIERRAKQH
jgi:hypothetical protein